jgi:photosystem II stability/assembly factor-like uncharacterized protein
MDMKVLKSAALLCLLIYACTSDATAQGTLWQDLGLYGGQINRIAIDPYDSRYLYAGSWNGEGFFASEDSGETWLIGAENPDWFRNLEVYDIDIDPNNPENIWVANNHYVDVSHDYGLTWKTFFFASDEGRFCYAVKVDPHDVTGDTVYVGTGGPNGTDELGVLYKTIDGGATWFKMENTFPDNYQPFNIWDIDVNPAVPNEIWATSRKAGLSPEGRIFMTMDGGNQWWSWNAGQWFDGKIYLFSFLDEILVHPWVRGLIFSADGYGVLRKQDGTNTAAASAWSWVTDATGCRSLCIAPSGSNPVYAGLRGSVAKSTDNGDSWNYYDRPGEFLTLAADPFNPDLLFGGDLNQGIFKSSDGAQTWQPKNTGVRANQVFSTAVFPAHPETLVAGTLAGVYRQTNEESWTQINDSIAYTVSFHPAQKSTLFAGFDWELGKSTDSGATWTYADVSDRTDGHKVSSIAVSKDNPDVILAGVAFSSGKRGEIIKSTDSGTSYRMVWETTVPVNAVEINPENSQIVFAGTGNFYAPVSPGAIYKSTDGGKTLAPASTRQLVVNSIAIAAGNPNLIYIGCGASNNSYSGIYKSTDAGITWEEKTGGLPRGDDGNYSFAVTGVKIDAANPDIVYASLYRHGIYVSLDGGTYWTCTGLSDYIIFHVNSASDAAHAAGGFQQNSLKQNIPSSVILAGTASGMFKCSSSGTGLLSGTITAQDTGVMLDNAAVSSSSGSSCASSEGFYLLMMPAGVHDIEVAAEGYDSALLSGMTINAGEMVTRDITLAPAGSDGGGCAATELLKNSPGRKHLPVLRAFRDMVLKKSPVGSRLTARYYAAEGDVRKVLKKNPQLRVRAVRLLQHAMPVVLSSLSTKSVSIPSSLLNEASCFLFDLEQASPARLKERINTVRKELKGENFLRLVNLH